MCGEPLILTPRLHRGVADPVHLQSAREDANVTLGNRTSYAAFFTTDPDPGNHLFWWYFPPIDANPNAPILVWLQVCFLCRSVKWSMMMRVLASLSSAPSPCNQGRTKGEQEYDSKTLPSSDTIAPRAQGRLIYECVFVLLAGWPRRLFPLWAICRARAIQGVRVPGAGTTKPNLEPALWNAIH